MGLFLGEIANISPQLLKSLDERALSFESFDLGAHSSTR
jgi:hypothetical protein